MVLVVNMAVQEVTLRGFITLVSAVWGGRHRGTNPGAPAADSFRIKTGRQYYCVRLKANTGAAALVSLASFVYTEKLE